MAETNLFPYVRSNIMRTIQLLTTSFCVVALAAACGDADETSTASTTQSSSSGMGGASSSSTAMGGASSSSTAMGGASSSNTGGGPVMVDCTAGADNLLISEVGIASTQHEFLEIWNPGTDDVKLDGYYVSDNSTYHGLATGAPWEPIESVKGSDFLAHFPAGAVIKAGAYITIAAGTGFETGLMTCPDYALGGQALMCNNQAVPAMVAPPNGSVGSQLGGMFSNSGEMAILFCWDGVSNTVKDVDYVHWNDPDKSQVLVDKSGVAGYQPDTAKENQKYLESLSFKMNEAGGIERCGTGEASETATGGNGIAGHDETSEDTSQSFQEFSTATPGAMNDCK